MEQLANVAGRQEEVTLPQRYLLCLRKLKKILAVAECQVHRITEEEAA